MQIHGGGVSDAPSVAGWREYFHEQANCEIEATNATLGRVITHVTRPFEQLFPIVGDTGRNIFAGRLPNGRPAAGRRKFPNLDSGCVH